MSFLKRNNKLDVLVKAQNNLEASQKNIELMIRNQIQKDCDDMEIISEEKQKEAAYAMNFCMVSISQIIDYDDIYILEQEYEYILNNLNLEKMPKDESLLNIFKLLLDTITFFRIQEGDKKFIEEEYQHRMKNAIWSAVPNFGLLVAGGSWQTALISLASQVGIGYMNYRREKSQNNLDKREQEWQLTRSAIEQFNGLRRELFETAWRLAEKYNFPDKFRITENQITQFNKILMDTNSARKFERLEYIKDKFEAYPPFWYYLGNAANNVYQEHNTDEDCEEYSRYKLEAINAFEEYLGLTKHNILREDPLAASCSLELFDLIDDIEEKNRLLDHACKYAGNSLDVLQICAMSYLEIGNIEKACDILRMLVNEGYNSSLNCRLLSKLYVHQYSNALSDDSKLEYKQKYDTLKERICFRDKSLFFPMLSKEEPENSQDEKYISSQKKSLIYSYADSMYKYITQCENKYNEILFHSGDDIRDEFTLFVKEVCDAFAVILQDAKIGAFFSKIKNKLNNKNFGELLCSQYKREHTQAKISFRDVFNESIDFLISELKLRLGDANDMKSISYNETNLYSFLAKAKLTTDLGITIASDVSDFAKRLWGREYIEKSEHQLKAQEVFRNINTASLLSDVDKASRNISLHKATDVDFQTYKSNLHGGLYSDIENNIGPIIAILETKKDALVFTTRWFDTVYYQDVQIDEINHKIVGNNRTLLKNKYINMSVLKDIIGKLTEISNSYTVAESTSYAYKKKTEIEDTAKL